MSVRTDGTSGVRPDFIAEGQEHLWPSRRDKSGLVRDFIPEGEEFGVGPPPPAPPTEPAASARPVKEK